MWKQKSIVLLICGCGFLAAGLGASVEPGGGPITIPLFSYNANCFLTTVGCGFKVAKMYRLDPARVSGIAETPSTPEGICTLARR